MKPGASPERRWPSIPRSERLRTRAFSSEVGTGSREENASNKKIEPRSDSIGTEKALAITGVAPRVPPIAEQGKTVRPASRTKPEAQRAWPRSRSPRDRREHRHSPSL